jgi:uncharacterized membrane protein YuzA (DUF378 family)
MVEPHFPVPPPPDLAGTGSSRAARVATTVALMLMVIGGFNWALVGLFNMDFVAALFGPMTVAARTVYVAVGVAALYGLTLLPRIGQGPL